MVRKLESPRKRTSPRHSAKSCRYPPHHIIICIQTRSGRGQEARPEHTEGPTSSVYVPTLTHTRFFDSNSVCRRAVVIAVKRRDPDIQNHPNLQTTCPHHHALGSFIVTHIMYIRTSSDRRQRGEIRIYKEVKILQNTCPRHHAILRPCLDEAVFQNSHVMRWLVIITVASECQSICAYQFLKSHFACTWPCLGPPLPF